MKVKWICYCIAALPGLLALAGCGSSQLPSGEFTSELEGQEITIQFDGNDNFVILRGGREFAEGKYAVEGNQLTWLSDSSCAMQDGETATYSWTFENQILTFSLIEKDSCMSRLYMLEKLPYEKRP